MVKFNTRDIFKNDIFQLSLIVGVVSNLLLWVILYLRVPYQEDPIALQYNIYYGINLIGDWHQLFSLPITGLVILATNFILAIFLYGRERMVSFLLLLSAAVSQFILLYAGHLITTFI